MAIPKDSRIDSVQPGGPAFLTAALHLDDEDVRVLWLAIPDSEWVRAA